MAEDREYVEDPRVADAIQRILKIISEQQAVTDRELKVRLEKVFFPWVVSQALARLLGREVEKVGYPGRPSASGGTESFYVLVGTKYDAVQGIIRQKRIVANMVADVLTGVSEVSTYAEDLFRDGFVKLGFKVHDRDVSEFRGRSSVGVKGKEKPNLDFIVERDGLIYGVDVKNWIRYEYDSRDDVRQKVQVALALGVIPWIIARYVDKDTIYTEVYERRGIAYPYVTLLLPASLRSLAEEASRLLGYPMLATDALPEFKLKHLEELHQGRLKRRRF